MHKADAQSLVLWYDSVTNSGALKWQSALNDKNDLFFQGSGRCNSVLHVYPPLS